MRRGGDDHRLQSVHREQVIMLLKGSRAVALKRFHLGGALLEICAVHIAQRQHLHAADFKRGLEVHHAPPTAADETELELGA